jgi:dethiobiotin synthetase
VTGTDAGVGKTAVACGILAALRARGVRAAPFKPVEAGHAPLADGWTADGAALRAASGLLLRPEEVVPYPTLEGAAVDLNRLDKGYEAMERQGQMVVVEGAGGLAVPMRKDPWFTMGDLAAHWALPVLIVARPGGGTVNHTMLTVEYARRRGLQVLGVVLNGASAEPTVAERSNPETIAQMAGVPVLGVLPQRGDVDIAAGQWQGMAESVERSLDLWRVQAILRR